MGKRKRRRRRGRLPFDMGRNPVGVFLSILTLLITLAALVLETGLSWAAVGLSVAATAGWAKYDQQRQKKAPKSQKPPDPRTVPPPKRAQPKPAPGHAQQPKALVRCTVTGKDIEVCTCYSRHIRKVPNQYKKPLGEPYGTPGKGGGGRQPDPLRPAEAEPVSTTEGM